MVKDTSLAASITVVELFTAAQQIAARTYEPFALYCEAALIYLMFCTVLTWLQGVIEKSFVHENKNISNIDGEGLARGKVKRML